MKEMMRMLGFFTRWVLLIMMCVHMFHIWWSSMKDSVIGRYRLRDSNKEIIYLLIVSFVDVKLKKKFIFYLFFVFFLSFHDVLDFGQWNYLVGKACKIDPIWKFCSIIPNLNPIHMIWLEINNLNWFNLNLKLIQIKINSNSN